MKFPSFLSASVARFSSGLLILVCASCTSVIPASPPHANAVSLPSPALTDTAWRNRALPPQERATALLNAMTTDEKLRIVMGFTDPVVLLVKGAGQIDAGVMAEVMQRQVPGSAGYVPGVDRLGIPGQSQTDASIGVRVYGLPRTALPSSLATAASFDPAVTTAGGVMIAREARQSGFNVFLAGGANLAREPRNGRNFEYAGEDPLLTGTMVSGLIRGIQSQHMVSTMKHFAVNDQESQRTTLDVRISPQAMHQSDLLAFEFILDWAKPGSVMCAYNRLNGDWACENDALLNGVLKSEWGFTGYVMSDWGAVHSVDKAVNSGLDQMTGFPCCGDGVPYFARPLKEALNKATVSAARLDDMVLRILRPLFESGAYDDPPVVGPIDFQASAQVAQSAAEQSLVLLKNQGGLLPLSGHQHIAVIGGHADQGVLSGGGSSGVTPVGGNAVMGIQPVFWPGPVVYLPSSPLRALRQSLPDSQVDYDDGDDVDRASQLASKSDVAIVFVTQWMTEGFDGSLSLSGKQDQLVASVARANPHTIVVVESGGAVAMPWLPQVPAVLAAFYPGARGGEAIARILSGAVNPSGHLPITFPIDDAQTARDIAGRHLPDNSLVSITYDEGAALGYKWFDLVGAKPLFAFGHGLSYTQFAYTNLAVQPQGEALRVSFQVRNTGSRAGAVVPQIYVAAQRAAGWESVKRLGAFSKVMLSPGEVQSVTLTVDRRLLAIYNESHHEWNITPGAYDVLLGAASDDIRLQARIDMPGAVFSAKH